MTQPGMQSRWRPVMRGQFGQHAVAPDARLLREQLAEYVPYASHIQVAPVTGQGDDQLRRAAETVRGHVIDALCLCEDVHGYGAICDHVLFVAGLIACAQAVLPGGVARAALVSGYANAGMLTGLLVEQLADIPAGARKFLAAASSNQDTSPHLVFSDCVLGTSVARQLDELTADALAAGAPFACLAHMARRAQGAAGRAEIRRLSEAASRQPDNTRHFIALVLASQLLSCGQASVGWNNYVTSRLTLE